MPDDRDGGGDDDGNVVYLPRTKTIEVFKDTPKTRQAERSEPAPTRRWRPAIILATLAFVAAMLVALEPWGDLPAPGDVAASLGRDLLVLAAIAGVLVLGAALARKRGRPRRGLRRPPARIREARGDRRMELHVWCEFEVGHEPTMVEALETCLANLYDDEERESWTGR